MQRRPLLLLLFSLPLALSIAAKSNAQARPSPYIPKTPDEKAILQLVKARYPKTTVTRLAIADRYGLYSWIDGETGGQAVVSRDAATNRWQFVRGTGGALAVSDIIRFGVPQEIAQRLVDVIHQQVRSSSPGK